MEGMFPSVREKEGEVGGREVREGGEGGGGREEGRRGREGGRGRGERGREGGRLHKYFVKTNKAVAMVSQLLHFLLSCDISTHITILCSDWSHTVQCGATQTAIKEVTRPLPSLVEWGVAMQD